MTQPQPRTLVVGCGYLGRRVGRLLSNRGERVFGTTRSAARSAELACWGVEAVVVDVLAPDSLANLPTADRALYCVGFDRSAGVPIRQVYVDGLRLTMGRLLDRVGSLVYASSTGVYGGDDGGWVDEDSPTGPRTESGRACLDAEGVIRDFEADGRLPATILRYSGLYGPDRLMRREALIRGEEIIGDPEKILNLVHIDDAATAAVTALDRARGGELYLVSDDRPAPRREYYRLAAEALKAPVPRFRPPTPGTGESSREGSNKRVSNRRMHAGLGVTLRYPDITTGVPAALAAVDEDRSP